MSLPPLAQGVWDQVAVQSLSEFGRTIATNGLGTDHAWGGNHFLIGGDVKGGTIHGQYPELRVDGPQSVSGCVAVLAASCPFPMPLYICCNPRSQKRYVPHYRRSLHCCQRW